MRHHQSRPALAQLRQRALDLHLRHIVERGSRFVENEHGRIFQKGARDGNTLFLSARQLDAPLAHFGIVTARQAHDVVVNVGALRGEDHFRLRFVGGAVHDIVAYASRKQKYVLRHHGDFVPQRSRGNVVDVLDIDFFKELCLKHGELRHYKKNEFILHEGDACSFFGFILSGVVKYSCTNRTENKPYNVGFSFPNEFIADYPTCLYGMKSELNIQAIIPCEIYICSSTFLQQKFKENNENQRIARIAAEQMFFQSYSRYLDLFRFTPEERYLQLLKKCPAILQMVSLKEIASYLKITPIHMSRIRRKQSFDNKK